MDRFGRAFPTAYEETFTVNQGVADLAHLDRSANGQGTSVALYRPAEAPDTIRRFKLFRVDPLSLTDILPIFTHMGVEVVDEQPFEVERADGTTLHVYDFGLRVRDAAIWEECPHDRLRELFEGAVSAVWDGRAESDGFNRLVLAAQLTWRQVVVLRTVAKYLRQARATYSQDYLEDALVSHPAIARDLVELWETRFDLTGWRSAGWRPARRDDGRRGGGRPARPRRPRRACPRSTTTGSSAPSSASSAPGCARTSTRTAPTAPSTSRTSRSSSTPRPCPTCPRLARSSRSGSTARGSRACTCASGRSPAAACAGPTGARTSAPRSWGSSRRRWSRTPSSSRPAPRAGSTPSSCPTRRSTARRGWRRARRHTGCSSPGCSTSPTTASRARSCRPRGVVRHDGDDPYLVVAADKGTATFSDIANGVAQSYGFWLDDAFASGGSAGYDHKAMGITARGAWESVKRHFREMGVDTQSQDFTVVGIGDMSGDVFGNGMLLSEHIRLVAAFDHRHVFVDPEPGCGDVVRGAPAAVRRCPARRGTTTTARSSPRAAASSRAA